MPGYYASQALTKIQTLISLQLTSGVANVSQQHDGAPNVASCVNAEHRLHYLHRCTGNMTSY